jgi:hypothetical protein
LVRVVKVSAAVEFLVGPRLSRRRSVGALKDFGYQIDFDAADYFTPLP